MITSGASEEIRMTPLVFAITYSKQSGQQVDGDLFSIDSNHCLFQNVDGSSVLSAIMEGDWMSSVDLCNLLPDLYPQIIQLGKVFHNI